MDVITRAEFEDAMSRVVTKDQLTEALAGTKADILETTKAVVADARVEIIDSVERKLGRFRFDMSIDLRRQVDDAKNEILATTRRDIVESIAPLATKAEMRDGFDRIDRRLAQMDSKFEQVDSRFEQVDSRFEQMDSRFEQMDSRFEQMDSRFEQVDARLAKLEKGQGTIIGSIAQLTDFVKKALGTHEERLKDAGA